MFALVKYCCIGEHDRPQRRLSTTHLLPGWVVRSRRAAPTPGSAKSNLLPGRGRSTASSGGAFPWAASHPARAGSSCSLCGNVLSAQRWSSTLPSMVREQLFVCRLSHTLMTRQLQAMSPGKTGTELAENTRLQAVSLSINFVIAEIAVLSLSSCSFENVRQLLSNVKKLIIRNTSLTIPGNPDQFIAQRLGEKCSNSFLYSLDNFSMLLFSSEVSFRGLTFSFWR